MLPILQAVLDDALHSHRGKTECLISYTVDMHICVKQKTLTAQIQMKTV